MIFQGPTTCSHSWIPCNPMDMLNSCHQSQPPYKLHSYGKFVFIEWACSSSNGKMNTIFSLLNTGNTSKTFKFSHDCIHFRFWRPCNQVLKNNVDYCYDLLNNKGNYGSTYYKKNHCIIKGLHLVKTYKLHM
jgi:hypothetical protein